ncbi:2-oxoglutarate-acceptor oxidoreductase subunit OorD [bacterium BMS3Abin07]|nr:2-oxoglutarate-acceptor oxidoreductase subunit OorD [bacterium BMS3Abin07]GBE31422.1 2-oxoglutarate-acceptor oxidoreductase subunit OorD [bacterium BMS3Bbin05]HDL21251.1 ferredoxin family protein [Nitrospirota bacterium]HDO22185.1 ferredoxin family protein [Nitrospirota bacterium]HDZ87345.1 ferredoxin family protein [Nitrospirota bacterium]
MKGKIVIDRERCKGCQYCVLNCPQKLIEIDDAFNTNGFFPAVFRDENGCTGCALCAISCPDIAIEVYREDKD